MWPFKSRVQKEREAKILRLKQNLRWEYEVLEYIQKREESSLSTIEELEQSIKELTDANE